MVRRTWKALLVSCGIVAAGAAGFYSGLSARATSLHETSGPPVQVAPGYKLRLVAAELSAPVGVAAGLRGEVYVAESGAGTGTPPRVVQVAPGKKRTILAFDFPAPLTGMTWHAGKLYVSYVGGVDVLDPATGLHHPILSKLPAQGDYGNGPVAFGPDGSLYLGIGTATNAGVVGEDNVQRGWVAAHPDFRDIPCKSVTVRGSNFNVANPLTPDPHDQAATGAFSSFGKTTARLQVIPGTLPCTGAVMRAKVDGTGLELVAWGLRYPAGLAFGPDGRLYATMQGYEDRGSRPVVGDHDYVYRVEQDQWYGWPDFAGGRSVADEEFQKHASPATSLLAAVPGRPPNPVARLAHGSGAAGLIFPPERFGLRGDGLVALGASGEVLRLNPATGAVQPVLRGVPGPVALAPSAKGTVYLAGLGDARPGAPVVPGTGAVWELTPIR